MHTIPHVSQICTLLHTPCLKEPQEDSAHREAAAPSHTTHLPVPTHTAMPHRTTTRSSPPTSCCPISHNSLAPTPTHCPATQDYDKIQPTDKLSILGLKTFAPGVPLTVEGKRADGTTYTFTVCTRVIAGGWSGAVGWGVWQGLHRRARGTGIWAWCCQGPG